MENNGITLSASVALAQVNETASSTLATRAQATIQARHIMAERHPRDLDTVRERILKDCKRPSFAAVAIYHKPIGRGVEGPSIRFAEAALRHMTNVAITTDTVFDDPEKRIVSVCVTDVECNVPYSQDVTVTKTVERRSLQQGEKAIRTRVGAGGQLLYIVPASDDDINGKQNALISKAIRTLGLRLIPGDIVDEAMEQVRATQANQDATDPDAARRKLFDGFGSIGVQAEQLKAYLGHDCAVLSPAEMKELRGIYTALRDGETNWREVIDAKHPPKKEAQSTTAAPGSLKDTLRNRRAEKANTEDAQTSSEPAEVANAEGR